MGGANSIGKGRENDIPDLNFSCYFMGLKCCDGEIPHIAYVANAGSRNPNATRRMLVTLIRMEKMWIL